MTTVTLEIRSLSDALDDFAQAWKSGKGRGDHRIGFKTPELLWRVLTQKRWEILKCMTGAGGLTVREIARRAGRDVKAVHGDVQALIKAGLLRRTEDGKVVFPFDEIRVDFRL